MSIETLSSSASSQTEAILAEARFARSQANAVLDDLQREELFSDIEDLLNRKDAVLVAHYYVDGEIQDLAEKTGGCVSDSLEMARFGYEHPASTVVVAGVRFMAETAKILSPEKRVFAVEEQANCSLDLGCPAEPFSDFCDQHPDRTVVVYANTSAAVKARADWVVTSSIGLKLVQHLHSQGHKILWAPDKYLGNYIQRQSGADMLMWDGACIVHEEFKGVVLEGLMKQFPKAKVLVHPESPESVIALADVVGSTSQIIQASQDMPEKTFIVATEKGILHKMQSVAPDKRFITAPTAGEGATCESCAHCPWMKMNDLMRLKNVLVNSTNEVTVDETIRKQAQRSILKMVEFGKQVAPPPVTAS